MGLSVRQAPVGMFRNSRCVMHTLVGYEQKISYHAPCIQVVVMEKAILQIVNVSKNNTHRKAFQKIGAFYY